MNDETKWENADGIAEDILADLPDLVTHACPTCGDVHLWPAQHTAEDLRAKGWGEDYIERHLIPLVPLRVIDRPLEEHSKIGVFLHCSCGATFQERYIDSRYESTDQQFHQHLKEAK